MSKVDVDFNEPVPLTEEEDEEPSRPLDFKVRKVTAAMANRLERVYLETTFISYLVAEDSRDALIARRQTISRGCFERQRHKYDCVVSTAVEDECRRGDREQAARRMAILANLSTLAVNSEIMEGF